jgi:hypothetical protein
VIRRRVEHTGHAATGSSVPKVSPVAREIAS